MLNPKQPPPRVCIVLPQEPAISETFLRAHISAFERNGLQIYGGPIFKDEAGRPLLQRMGMHRRLLNATLRRLTRTPNWTWGHTLAAADYLKREKVSVVLAEYGIVGAQILDACRLARIPLVVHFHGYDAYQHDVLRAHEASYRQMFDYAKAVVAVSKDMRSQLIKLGSCPERTHHISCGVDTDIFQGACPGAAGPKFLAVGRLVPKKAPHLTLLAFRKVLDQIPEAKLTIIGEGPLRPICEQLIRALGMGTSVNMLGAQPHSAVLAEMRRTRVFVQHSITAENGDSEGTPLSVLEAQSCGIPVVTTRHGGIPDVVFAGQTGFLVDELDVVGMAEKMVELTLDPDKATHLGNQGRDRILNHSRLDAQTSALVAAIEACLPGTTLKPL